MSLRAVLLWWIVAGLLVVAAVATTRIGPAATSALPERAVAFPALRAAPDTVGEIRLTGADGALTLVAMADGGWTLAERDGFPVASDAVRRLVALLADMRLLEAKTERADRFARLAVEPVTADGARSSEVRLSAVDGAVLADVVVGDRVGRLGGFSEDGTYIRRADDERAWLASGRVEVSTAAVDWLVREIVDLPADRVVAVRMAPAGDAAYAIERADPAGDFVLSPPPEAEPGETVEIDAAAVQRLAGVLAGLRLEDVAAVEADRTAGDAEADAVADAVDEDATAGAVEAETATDTDGEDTAQGAVEVVTADGLVVTATLVERDAAPWLSLTAETGTDAAAAVVEEAAALNDRWTGWQFRLPAFAASRLTAPSDDLTVVEDSGT